MRPLALTMGDPAGIGGEVTAKAWHARRATGPVFCVLDDSARFAALGIQMREITSPEQAAAVFATALPVLPVRLRAPALPGKPDAANAPAVIESITRAVALAQSGRVGAVVTNPINKAALYQAGFTHPGHTEFLAALTHADNPPVMMLASPALRVVPVTVHLALRQAIATLTTDLIVTTARITYAALQTQFAIAAPRLAIAGLNPHAGEAGALGDDEEKIIAPAIAALRAMSMNVTGPWPPDTLFTETARARYDVAICMYHDQALIPLKTLDMHRGVNVTLGLPIIRTSPDHGTAYDIAGKNVADPSSLLAALDLAAQLAGLSVTSIAL
ncbi:MAG: 4-hydroxythreonine-4-phosphate dehydrogenase PdxA [Acetobacteraceae bacterium]|nr:4-hydroxythreonine-4-phosphate dehydrogenase PdxA [Acetobacteraceae bacterium]MSP29437.1 4-hydroxythreonine-4-phosphate dehydrogenase PdxA [Acetobacteraceae bacterium]